MAEGRSPPCPKDSLDWAKIFAAAKTGGVKNYFLEQNWDLTVQDEADPVLCNLRITQSYHDLSAALARVIDPDDANCRTTSRRP